MTIGAYADVFIARIENLDQVVGDIAAKIPTVETAIAARMQSLHIELANRVATEKLSGDPLKEQSANLKNSVIASPQTFVEGDTFRSIVGSDLVYARIHELGGDIVPKNGDYLTFKTADGNWVRTKKVTMPARPYLAPTLEEMLPDIETGLEQAITEALLA